MSQYNPDRIFRPRRPLNPSRLWKRGWSSFSPTIASLSAKMAQRTSRSGNSKLPWALAFSFARAIQQPALEIWQGKDANVPAAQQALLHRARCNRAARRGEYNAAMERRSV